MDLGLLRGAKLFLQHIYAEATELNQANILGLLPSDPGAVLLDVGCDDGVWTSKLASHVGTRSVHGVEIVEERARMAVANGVDARVANLANGIPFEDGQFDIVHSNQVIEHVPEIDLFVSEVFRVLRPGGMAIISTENASSWHNIAALSLGWQMFSLTNLSSKSSGVGNPFALHRHETCALASWTHKVIFSYRGLIELCQVHGFTDVVVRGAGYHPMPPRLGCLDVRHAHFLALRARKP